MHRSFQDDLGRSWHVDLVVPDHAEEAALGDAILVFGGDGAEERSVPVLGPMESVFHELDDDALQVAFDAAGSGVGLVLVDRDGEPWWVQGADPDSEHLQATWAIRFVQQFEEITHDGPLRAPPEELTEDELLELLDEARGDVMEEMDVTGA